MNLQFDEMISSPSRLAILAALVPGPPVSFSDMKTTTGLADGNLHVQTHKLADIGYIQIGKTRQGRRSVTEFRNASANSELSQLLTQVLDRANYEEVSADELQRAFKATSLFELRLFVDLDDAIHTFAR